MHLDPVVTTADVSERDLNSIECMMAEYRESVYQAFASPSQCEKLTSACVALSEYLSDVLQPISVTMRYANSPLIRVKKHEHYTLM